VDHVRRREAAALTPAPAWLDELRLDSAPPFQTMGTHTLDAREWLIVDDRRDDELRLKERLIRERRDVVVAAVGGSDADDAAREVHELVSAAVSPGAPAQRVSSDALVDASLLAQEDLVVLQRRDGAWRVTAGVVCFPTHWCIRDKLGRSLADVHGSVAHYEHDLRERVDRFHDRLTPERPVWRRNWFVTPTDDLHLPSFPPGLVIPGHIARDGAPMWIRSERQTLRKLPRSGAIVFTIRVQLAPLGVLLQRRDLAHRMLQSVRSWDDTKRGDTSTGRILDALDPWLEDVTRPLTREA
jgi:hypothetical protein